MSKAKKPKGKKGGAKDGVDEGAVEKVSEMHAQLQTLQQMKVFEEVKADSSTKSYMELKEKVVQLQKDYKDEQQNLMKITSSMTTQYKQMQDKLEHKIQEYKNTIEQKDSDIKERKDKFNSLKMDYENKQGEKDGEIAELKKKIEDMSNEFARMLKMTLEKMQERIEFAKWDNDDNPQMMKRLKDITGVNQ